MRLAAYAPPGSTRAYPAKRGAALASIVDRLRTLHALDPSGVATRDPIGYTRATYGAAKTREGYPAWAADLAPAIAEIESTLARDPRRVVSHNDVNPINVMWDGARAWLIDWEVAGLAHPHYDLATLAMFLRLEDRVAFELCALHDGAQLDEPGRETFRALRKLIGILCGLTFLGLVDDLTVRPAKSFGDAPKLADVYQAMRAGTLDMQSALGRAEVGLALLANAIGVDAPRSEREH